MYTFLYSGYGSYWFWGLHNFDGLSFNTERIDILIVGIIIGLLILISGIKLVYSANLVRVEKNSFEDQKKTWLVVPSLAILGAITWFFYISNSGDGYFVPPGYDVWDFFRIDFGLIGAFSGGALSLLGYLFNKGIRETNIMSYFVINPRKEISVSYKKYPISEIQKKQHLETPNYCPMCGFKTGTTHKFCPGCGFKF
ncbi:MAG: hypothetical protein KGD58_00725 [Candidatus Lokiarchaeota archaeon]|nr:hypothetical protein [Candidatus Lokiarchaeota archaeon]